VLDPRETVVVLDPRNLLPQEASALGRFARRGGRLVAGGPQPGAWLEHVLDEPPEWESGGAAVVRPAVPAPETAGVGAVQSDGDGRWGDRGGTLGLLGPADAPLAVAASTGRGRIVLLADVSPLQNRLLGDASNAAFALALAGPRGRPVAFLESVHGYGSARGFAAVPARWRWGLFLLLLAALCLLAAHARRLGPAQEAARDLPPPRRAYVDALAATLARTDPRVAPAPLRDAARAGLVGRAAAGPEPGDAALRATATRHGLTDAETAAVLGADAGQDAALVLATALAKLEGGAG
jgi:hypothetical protein